MFSFTEVLHIHCVFILGCIFHHCATSLEHERLSFHRTPFVLDHKRLQSNIIACSALYDAVLDVCGLYVSI